MHRLWPTLRDCRRNPLGIAVLLLYVLAVLAGATHLAFHHAELDVHAAHAAALSGCEPAEEGHDHESTENKPCSACVMLARSMAQTAVALQLEAPATALSALPVPCDRPVFTPAHHHIQRGPPRLAFQA